MKILIVDDSDDDRALFKLILNNKGYQITDFGSAHELFGYLGITDPINCNETDLILMDIMMPEINGIDACKTIKKIEKFADLPIIMVTGKSDLEFLEQAFEAGAIDYINKPMNKTELLVRVRSALNLKYEMDCRKAKEKELLALTRQLQAVNEMLENLSLTDPLTGIANRRSFDRYFQQEWKRALREVTPLSIIMIDIDFFKKYNDFYGHQPGDECLKKVAQTLNNKLNRPADFIARYGGEEFIVLLPSTHKQGAAFMAETLREGIDELNIPHHSSSHEKVTISLGVITTILNKDLTPKQFIDMCDEALYKAKEEGRNRFVAVEFRAKNN